MPDPAPKAEKAPAPKAKADSLEAVKADLVSLLARSLALGIRRQVPDHLGECIRQCHEGP